MCLAQGPQRSDAGEAPLAIQEHGKHRIFVIFAATVSELG